MSEKVSREDRFTSIHIQELTFISMEKDERTQSIEADHLSVAKKDADDQIKISNWRRSFYKK